MQHITRRRIQIAYTVLFFVIFADGIAAFAFFMVIRADATREPLGIRTAPIMDHGHTYYVTAVEALVYHGLLAAMVIGVPLVVLSGAALELGLGIPVLRKRQSKTTRE